MSVSSSDDAVSTGRVRVKVTPEEYDSDQPAIGSEHINSSHKEKSKFCLEICGKNVGEGLIVAGSSGTESGDDCCDCLAITTRSALDVMPSYNNVCTSAGSAEVQSLMFSLDSVAVRNTEIAESIPVSSETSSSCDLPCCISNIRTHKKVCGKLSADKSDPKCFASTVPSATDDGMTDALSFSKSVMKIFPGDASFKQLPVKNKNTTVASAVPDMMRIVSEDDFAECVDGSKLGIRANEVMGRTVVNSVESKWLSPPPRKLAGEDCNRDSAFTCVSHASRISSGFQPQVTSSASAKVNHLSSFEFHENQNTAFSASGADHSQITHRNACQRQNAFSFVGCGKKNTTISQAQQQPAIEEVENVRHPLKHNDVTGSVPAVRSCSTSHFIVQPSVLQSAGQNEVTSTKYAACPVTHSCYFPFHQVVNDSENDESGCTVENTLSSVSCTANRAGNSSGNISNTLWRPFEVNENAMALELGNATDSGRSFKSTEVAGIDDGYQGNQRDKYRWARRGDKQDRREVGQKDGVLEAKQSSNLYLCCSNLMSQGYKVPSYPGLLGPHKQLDNTHMTRTVGANDVQITSIHLNGDESQRSLFKEFVIPMKSKPVVTVDMIGHKPEENSLPDAYILGKHAQFASREEIQHHGKIQAVNTERPDIVSIPASRENCIFNPRTEHVPLVQQGSQQQLSMRQAEGMDGVTMLSPCRDVDSSSANSFYSQNYVECDLQHCPENEEDDCQIENNEESSFIVLGQVFWRKSAQDPVVSLSVTTGGNDSYTNGGDLLHVDGRVDDSTMNRSASLAIADEVSKADQVLSYLKSFLVNSDAEENISADTHEEEESHVWKTQENSTSDNSTVFKNCKKGVTLETAIHDVGCKNNLSKRQERQHTSFLGRKRKPEVHGQTKLSTVSAASPDTEATFNRGAVVTEPVETDETFRTNSTNITVCVQPNKPDTSQKKLQAEHTQLLQTHKDPLLCSENGNASLDIVDEDPQADVNGHAISYLKSLLENNDAERNIPEDTCDLTLSDEEAEIHPEKTCQSSGLDGSTLIQTSKQGKDLKTKMHDARSSTVRKIKPKEFCPMNTSKKHKHHDIFASFMNDSNLVSRCSQEECIDEKPRDSLLSSLLKSIITRAPPVTSEEMTELSENVFERSQRLGNTQKYYSVEENLRTYNTGEETSSMSSFSNSEEHIGASWEKKQTPTMTTLKEWGQKRCSRTPNTARRGRKRQKTCSSGYINTLSAKIPFVDTSLPNGFGNILSDGFVLGEETWDDREIVRNQWLQRLRKRSVKNLSGKLA